MYLLHLRPLFVELPIFVLDGLVLLEPRDLVREQTRRNLRRAAADLRGGEERSYGKVERLLAGVRSGGTGLIGQQLRRPGQRGSVGGVVGQCRLWYLVEHGTDGGNSVLALDLPHAVRNARGVGDGVERGALFGSAQDDVHDGRRLVGERHGARRTLSSAIARAAAATSALASPLPPASTLVGQIATTPVTRPGSPEHSYT